MIKGFKKNGEILKYDYNALENLPANTALVEPMDDDIPKVFFSEAIPQDKNYVKTKFRYVSKTLDVSGYAEFKAQGNSSMNLYLDIASGRVRPSSDNLQVTLSASRHKSNPIVGLSIESFK